MSMPNTRVAADDLRDPDLIIEALCAFRKVSRSDLADISRVTDLTWPRHELVTLLRQHTMLSLVQIGALVGGRDAKTIMNSLDRVSARCAQDKNYFEAFASLRAAVLAYDPAGQARHLDAAAFLARKVLNSATANPADVQSLALTVLTVASILRSRDLTDLEARQASLTIIGNTGGRSNGA